MYLDKPVMADPIARPPKLPLLYLKTFVEIHCTCEYYTPKEYLQFINLLDVIHEKSKCYLRPLSTVPVDR